MFEYFFLDSAKPREAITEQQQCRHAHIVQRKLTKVV